MGRKNGERAHRHDASYRLLFAHPQMVETLVRDFVAEPWVEDLDFSTLQRLNATYVTGTLERRESDMVWKLRRQDGSQVYVYLLIEFQSRPDRFMAVRLMVYLGLLYEDLISRGELLPGRRLPLVIPLVVYNRDRKWRQPLDLADLVERVDGPAAMYVPSLRYRVIDQGSYPPEDLARQDSLVSLLFWLEKNRHPESAPRMAARWLRKVRARRDQPLRHAFTEWLDNVLPGQRFAAGPENLKPEELETMLEERVREWSRELRREGQERGLERGLKQGRKEGLKEGEASLLLRQLERKFGPLDAKTKARVRKASSERLLEWGDRILTAERLSQVFGD
jgi:predicted transposase/invertase (TIGR01784 family)